MSKEYPCIYFEEDGLCRKFADGRGKVYCAMEQCPHQKESNADKFRAMSDEELAHMIIRFEPCTDICLNEYENGRISEQCDKKCFERALKWLQQPCEGE